jgi:polyisoprenoid-binding protein YceI
MWNKRILAAALCGSVALAGCSTRLEHAHAPGPKPATTAATATPGASPSAARAQAVPLSAENVRVTFIGTAGPTSHEGGFEQLTGEWQLPTENPKDSRLSIRIDTASVHTKIGLLTAHLKRDDFFDVKQFPTATFTSTQIVPEPGPDGATHRVTGDFTIHGVTKAISFPAKVSVTPDAASLDGRFTISQTAFGMASGAEKTRDEVPVTVSANASRR